MKEDKKTMRMHTAASTTSMAAKRVMQMSDGGKGGEGRWWWEYCNNDGTNLFIDRVTLSEYKVTTEQPRNERIMRSLLSFPTAAVQFPLEEKKRLVNCDEFGEVRSMLFRCA